MSGEARTASDVDPAELPREKGLNHTGLNASRREVSAPAARGRRGASRGEGRPGSAGPPPHSLRALHARTQGAPSVAAPVLHGKTPPRRPPRPVCTRKTPAGTADAPCCKRKQDAATAAAPVRARTRPRDGRSGVSARTECGQRRTLHAFCTRTMRAATDAARVLRAHTLPRPDGAVIPHRQHLAATDAAAILHAHTAFDTVAARILRARTASLTPCASAHGAWSPSPWPAFLNPCADLHAAAPDAYARATPTLPAAAATLPRKTPCAILRADVLP